MSVSKLKQPVCWLLTFVSFFSLLSFARAQAKVRISLDEFMNATEVRDAVLAPDGKAAVIFTESPDWEHDRFREDLWLWKDGWEKPVPLSGSGHDSSPVWSPDGRYVAFISDRSLAEGTSKDGAAENDGGKDEPGRIWLISIAGGEAFPLYRNKLDVHAFAWSQDSNSMVLSVTEPLLKDEEEKRKTDWKDVIRWREQERGDVLLAQPLAGAIQAATVFPAAHGKPDMPSDMAQLPAEARVITRSPRQIGEIAVSPTGDRIAFETEAVSHRIEDPADAEMFIVPFGGGDAHQLTHNNGGESHLHWDRSGDKIIFLVGKGSGSIEGPYRDVQGRLYSVAASTGQVTRLGAAFKGSWEDLTVTPEDTLMATGVRGIDQMLYRVTGDGFEAVGSRAGTYDHVHAALRGKVLLFTHSTITEATQVYVAQDARHVDDAKAITALNAVFAERAQVEWEPYRWKSENGREVEGVLIFPPGKKGTKRLRMLTLIHGGPEDADGNHFGADWYDWATLAAANGWLVFRPNYRGSTGYGDDFMLSISPHLVSGPGRDVLTGVDSLVRDGIADPDHLTIGGYSYGGYMTNWLITQTTRFKAAVTGAGAVEHAANWGNDDLTFDDAWYLSGTPWEKPELYQSEAALFQINKVTTPTHIVGGNADVRVSYLEQVLLERALQRLQIPHTLLVFPGENHPLAKDPWHGYIKVREELKWLEKYGGN